MKTIITRLLFLVLSLGLISSANAAVAPVSPVSGTPDPATVKASLEAFRSLSAKEKRARLKEVKKTVRAFKAQGKEAVANKTVQVICAILLPPLGVYLHEGELNGRFWISLLLTLLFYVPGLIYALIIVLGD
jgi:uncharacterized membrane protein YqaE (UPF0057 family)